MIVKCDKCGYEWDYQGKSAFHATCSKCQNKAFFFIKENLKYAKTITCAYCKRAVVKHRFQKKYCTLLCAQRASQPAAVVALSKNDQRGEKGHNWRGGISNNPPHYSKLQLERHPERIKCRKITRSLRRRGILIPTESCEMCNRIVPLHAHHEDYSRPDKVKWVCRKCHRKIHGGTH